MERVAHGKSYKSCLLILLMVILSINYVDRMALGVMLEEIKTDRFLGHI